MANREAAARSASEETNVAAALTSPGPDADPAVWRNLCGSGFRNPEDGDREQSPGAHHLAAGRRAVEQFWPRASQRLVRLWCVKRPG